MRSVFDSKTPLHSTAPQCVQLHEGGVCILKYIWMWTSGPIRVGLEFGMPRSEAARWDGGSCFLMLVISTLTYRYRGGAAGGCQDEAIGSGWSNVLRSILNASASGGVKRSSDPNGFGNPWSWESCMSASVGPPSSTRRMAA